MKATIILSGLFLISFFAKAQNNVSEIIGAGLVAAQDYSNSYMTPAGESFAFNLSTGWYDDAKSLDQWEFYIGFKAQATFAPDDKKFFILDPADYERMIQQDYDRSSNAPARVEVTFDDGSRTPREIATALGANNPSQFLILRALDQTTGIELNRSRIELAQGLESEGVDVVPTIFLQGGIGLGGGLELKARFVPKTQVYEAETALYGAAIQWEITRLFENDGASELPFRFAVLGGYTKVDAEYDFEDGIVVDGVDQKIETRSGSLTVAAIASTRFRILNFYAGVNYARGTTESDLLGTYTIRNNSIIYPVSTSFQDPITVSTDQTAIMGTLGARLSLGFFSMNGSFTLGEFSTASAAVAFRF